MSGRKFNMIAPALWKSARFIRLGDRERLLLIYFMTSPHQNSSGCATIPDAYAAADLGWTVAEYLANRAALVSAGAVDCDPDTSEIYVERWFKHCAPTNGKHAIGTVSRISNIESDRLREKVEADFSETKFANVLLSPAMAEYGE